MALLILEIQEIDIGSGKNYQPRRLEMKGESVNKLPDALQ